MTQEERWLLKEKYNGEKTAGFFTDCERLATGEPLGYVIGYVPFLDCKIWLDSRPLIPRPETEFWVEKVIEEIRKSAAAKPPRVLDLCAGSGAIGVAVAKTIPGAQITFGELESSHLPTIGKNLNENHIDCTRYQVFQSDLFAASNITGQFDFILSNPPYIDPTLDRTEKSVRDFEPSIALYGGASGMEIIERIIFDSSTYLSPTGQLWLEHEPEHSSAIKSLAVTSHFVATTHKDQYGVERFSVLVVE